jgi:hypothetical protein
MWLTERIYKFLGRAYNTVEKAVGDGKILNPFGSRQIFSPKITYFLLLQRIKAINPNNGPKKRKLVSFPEDLKQFNNKRSLCSLAEPKRFTKSTRALEILMDGNSPSELDLAV